MGWLIIGMFFGPHAFGLMSQPVLDAGWYKTVIMWMQCAFGLMLGTELVWKKLKSSLWKRTDSYDPDAVLGYFFLRDACFYDCILASRYSGLSRFCIRRNRISHRTCAGLTLNYMLMVFFPAVFTNMVGEEWLKENKIEIQRGYL